MSLMKVRTRSPDVSVSNRPSDSVNFDEAPALPTRRRTGSGLLADLSLRTGDAATGERATPQHKPSSQIRLPPRKEHSFSEGVTLPIQSKRSQGQRDLLPASGLRAFADKPNIVGVVDRRVTAASQSQIPLRDNLVEPFVACSDGLVRRFPPCEMAGRDYNNQLRQGGSYDTTSAHITRKLGGFEIHDEGRAVSFFVNQRAVEPTRIGSVEAFRLDNGRYLVPQPGFRDSLISCELMMLLDRRGLNPADHALRMPARGFVRRMEDVANSLGKKTGADPVIVSHIINCNRKGLYGRDRSRAIAWRDLSNKIDQFGPCILNKGSHAVMLDEVREEKGNFFLTIREPFHGSHMELRESTDLFRDQSRIPERASIQAIFLPRA